MGQLGADLNNVNKNLSIGMLPKTDETSKVFYNTSGLKLKNSHRRNSQNMQQSHGILQKCRARRQTAASAVEDHMKDIQAVLKTKNIQDKIMWRKATHHADLKTTLVKHKDQLGAFYRNKSIKNVQEHALTLSEESQNHQDQHNIKKK